MLFLQAHLLGLFDNVYRVEFHDKNYDQILKIISQETEEVALIEPVVAQVSAARWSSFIFVMRSRAGKRRGLVGDSSRWN